MKILKRIGIGLAIILVVLLVLSFIVSKDYKVEQSRVIDAPKSLVFSTVRDLGNHDIWNVWEEMDTTLQVQTSDQMSGKGASFSWTSEIMGSGKYAFTDEVYGERIDYRMEMEKYQPATGTWSFSETKKGTEVKWTYDGTVPWPMNLFKFARKYGIKMMLGKGLEGLDNHIVNAMDQSLKKYPVKEVKFPYEQFVVKKGRVPMEQISDFYSKNLRPIYSYVIQNNIDPLGQPCAIIYEWNPIKETTEMAVGLPIQEVLKEERFENYEIPYSDALQIDYYGDYEGTIEAHEAMENYLYKNDLKMLYPVIEQYETDPSEFPNEPNKWLTKIYYFVD